MRHMHETIAKAVIADFLGESFSKTQIDDTYEYSEKILDSLIYAHEIFANEFHKDIKFKQAEVAIILSLYYYCALFSPGNTISYTLMAYDIMFSKMWKYMIDAAIDSEKIDFEPAQKPKY